jgi:hypothetical protein
MVEVLCVWGLGTVSGTTVLLHSEAQELAILLAVKYFFRLGFSHPLFMLIVITSGLSKHVEAEDSGLPGMLRYVKGVGRCRRFEGP